MVIKHQNTRRVVVFIRDCQPLVAKDLARHYEDRV